MAIAVNNTGLWYLLHCMYSSSLHMQITMAAIPDVNYTRSCNENAVLQITILHMLGHNYNSMSCDLEIPVEVYKAFLLK
jgi:hypothetical protein